jgi:hypothetical protein
MQYRVAFGFAKVLWRDFNADSDTSGNRNSNFESTTDDNIRGPLLYLLEASGDLPLSKPDTAALV